MAREHYHFNDQVCCRECMARVFGNQEPKIWKACFVQTDSRMFKDHMRHVAWLPGKFGEFPGSCVHFGGSLNPKEVCQNGY